MVLSDTLVNFFDNYIPSLKDGQYKIIVSQTLSSDDPQVPAVPQPAVFQSFLVNGPRFSLPPADIDHVFPADNASGKFDQNFPQIVFTEKGLPWERNLKLSPVDDTVPWMALIVFAEDELPLPSQSITSGKPNPTCTSDLLLNDIVISSKTKGPPSNILGPSITLEANEDPNEIYCSAIDIPLSIFNSLIPTLTDAKWLAHTRQVSMTNKVAVQAKTGFFSAVIGNRFAVQPKAGTSNTNIVHLVSLEGFETFLNVSGQPSVTGFDFVRMISLYSWTFNVEAEASENFSTLMNNLLLPENNAGTDLLLKMPEIQAPMNYDSPAVLSIKSRLKQGYVALNYQMQSGEQSFAWYRGPLTPTPTSRFMQNQSEERNQLVPNSSSDAMQFDRMTGLFDHSYSVAFQTGRSLALASTPFATSLARWRKNSYALIDLIQEYITSPVYWSKMVFDGLIDVNGKITATGVTDLSRLLNNGIVTGAFTDFFATSFYRNLSATIGKGGGFTPDDSTSVIAEAPMMNPTGPTDLLRLMQEPVIIKLMNHLSGFANLGTLAAALNPNETSLTLPAPGLSEGISAGTTIILYSPDGKTSEWITVSDDTAANSTAINIKKYTGGVSLPAGTSLQVDDVDQEAETVVTWLANLALLYDVPFNNIIANPDLLPEESIRFFLPGSKLDRRIA